MVDGVGIGAGVVDRLRELGVGVIEVQGGAAADEPQRFKNRITELWWRMRGAYETGLDVEADADLRGQVASRRYSIESDRRIAIESKDILSAQGRKSPDEADALAMSFAVDYVLDGSGGAMAASDVPIPDRDGGNGRRGRVGLLTE